MSGSTMAGDGAISRHSGWSTGRWITGNAVGLGVTYGLFALFGDAADALGAEHGAWHGIAALAGLVIGASIFVALRARALRDRMNDPLRSAVMAGIGLVTGFLTGYAIAGPPFDFVLGVIALGAIGGALQWRMHRHRLARPGRLLVATIGAWLAAGVAGLAVALLAGDAVTTALGGDTTAGFVAITVTIGFLAGGVGGALEGAALRRSF